VTRRFPNGPAGLFWGRGMRFRIVAVLPVLACLSACATVENYQASLRSWVGAPEGELIAAWGVPDKVYELADGAKVVEFVHVEEYTTGGYTRYETVKVEKTGEATKAGSTDSDTYSETTEIRVPVQVPLEKHYYRCETRFTISADRIVTGWRHQGNGCRATAEGAASLARFGQW